MENSSQTIDKYWYRSSPAFSNQYGSILGIPLTPVGWFLKLRYRKISKLLRTLPGTTVLDVGCGSGVFLDTALKLGKKVIGIDYSQQMLKSAQRNLRNFPQSDYTLIHGNATALPIKNNSCEIVLASGLTDYLTKKEVVRFFSEIKRVLKKDGYVIITFPRQESPWSFLRHGIGLTLRQRFLKLPPMETAYSRQQINSLFAAAKITPLKWAQVLSTMWIVEGKRV